MSSVACLFNKMNSKYMLNFISLNRPKIFNCQYFAKKNCPYPVTNVGIKFLRHFSSDSSDKPDPKHPLTRSWNIIKQDMNYLVSILDGHVTEDNLKPKHIFPEFCDVLIIGGGVIGSSIAYWIKQRALSGLHVVVVEKDSSVINCNYKVNKYAKASTTLSVGGLRQQFSLPENIQMSVFGAEFLRNIDTYLAIKGRDKPDVQFTPHGYLFLATEKSAETLANNSKLQNSLGAKNELLTPRKIKEKWPWINIEDIALGCHGLENEGWLDPWSLLMAFKEKAASLGAEYINAELTGFNFREMSDIVMDGIEPGDYIGVNQANVRLPNGEMKTITFSQLVIAAGHQSGQVGDMLRMGTGPGFLMLPMPVEPRKRYVYCFHCPNGPNMSSPLLIDPSGMYFRREGLGGNYICGRSPDLADEPSCDNLDNVDYEFFNEKVWPALARRVPAFENIKVKSGWAGYYDFNTFDENAFIGPHPGYVNVYLATGFSGHGFQQAPAVGRAIMELMIDGYYVTTDLTRMQFERIFHEEYLRETNIV